MDLDRLFAQFQRTRDPARLGEVFDVCADDLFAVALHLCRDRTTAEDLVQSTFLVAIERADRHEAGRPLRPWLLGILHREAKRLRRRARRVPDAERLNSRAEPQPPQVMLAGETANAVTAALGEVPQPYRAVLELHLVQSLPPAGIAEKLQRSPGAVRTQLWRGLELLRKLLPKGLAVGVAAELGSRPALAAVRARVMEAASAKVAGAGAAGIGVLVGGLLMKKVLCGIAVVLMGALAWWQWPAVRGHGASAAPQSPAAAVAAVVQPIEGVTPTNADVETTRTPAGKDAPTAAGDPAAAPAVAAVIVPVLVVDGAGNAVPEAEVCVYEAELRKDKDGKETTSDPSDHRRSGEPRERVMTNSLGQARVTIDGPDLVSARKRGVGWSGDVRARPGMRELESELRITLLPTATVRGLVLLPDGKPAAGARVTGFSQPFHNLQLTGELPPTLADQQGRFVFEVLAGDDYSLRATRDGLYSEGGAVTKLKPGGEHEVVLRFPGACSVRGVLLDADGRPLQGRIALVAAERTDNRSAKCDADGRFAILLTKGGAFDLVGGVAGQTSAHATLVLDDARPHQEVTLRTLPFVSVSGKVVDERGVPCPGMHVGLNYVVDRTALHERRSDLHGILPRGPTAADGTFAFLAPAGYRYEVACQPISGNREIWVMSPAFAAPAEGLLVTVRDSDKQGFVVSGRVLVAEGEAPVPEFRISLTTHRAKGASSGPIGTGAGGRFRVGPLAVGNRYSLVLEADGLARAIVGPFDSTVREETVTVRMQRCGSVRCRVLRADGTPAIKVFASLERVGGEVPFSRAWQGETDADGRIEFRDVVPGAYKVHARAATAEGGVAVGDTVVRSAQQSDVQLVLQKGE